MNAWLDPVGSRRPMRMDDIAAVMVVERNAYGHPWSRGNFTDSLAAGYLAEVLFGSRGGVMGYFVAMTGVDEMHLLNLTVAGPWQGRGYGRELLDAIEAHARARRLAMLWLEVRQSNDRARLLYRRRGFDEVGLRPGYYPAAIGREDAVVMRLELGPAPDAKAP